LLEIIAVNDGSKDNSLKILNDYAKKYKDTIKVIDKENGGHGSTINKGLSLATGKYLRVIDTDDWVDIYNFPLFLEKLKTSYSDLIVNNYSKEHIYNGESESMKYTNVEYNHIYDFDSFDFSKIGEEYFYMSTSTYKTEILKKAKLQLKEKTFYVDMEFNTQAIPYVKTFEFIDLDIYRYFIGRADQSMNLANFVSHYTDHEKVMKGLIEKYINGQKQICSPNKQKYIEKILYYMLYTNYTIQIHSNTKRFDAMKIVKQFDAYLKNTDTDLYNMMHFNPIIKWARRFKFLPMLFLNGKYLLKLLGIIDLLNIRFTKLLKIR